MPVPANVAPVASSGSGAGSSAASVLIGLLTGLSLILLTVAIVPLQLLPARVVGVIATRRSDMATAGLLGLVALVVAYVVTKP
jgi:hypothetical protein